MIVRRASILFFLTIRNNVSSFVVPIASNSKWNVAQRPLAASSSSGWGIRNLSKESNSRLLASPEETVVSVDDISVELNGHKVDFEAAMLAASDLAEADKIHAEYLGKNGCVSKAMSYMRSLPNEEKPKLGALVGQIKSELEETCTARKVELGFDPEAEVAQEEKQPKSKKKKQAPPTPEVEIDIARLDIRVGVISKAWEHEEADKLFCEEIDIGETSGPRQIASGLRAYYKVDELEGQRVLVLANLKSRKLVGFPSHGMVLCVGSDDGSKVSFVEPPPEAQIGERVMVDGYDGEPASENQIIKKKMLDVIFPELKTDDSGIATYKGAPLSTTSGPCVAQDGMKNSSIS